jgi:hypothetical protein
MDRVLPVELVDCINLFQQTPVKAINRDSDCFASLNNPVYCCHIGLVVNKITKRATKK